MKQGIIVSLAGVVRFAEHSIPCDKIKVMEEHLFRRSVQIMRRYLKWYTYPLIYFGMTSLVCLLAWRVRPVTQRAGIEVIFKTIAVMPTVIWVGVITLWILAAVFFAALLFSLKKRFPSLTVRTGPGDLEGLSEKTSVVRQGEAGRSRWRKTRDRAVYVLGIALIVVGVSLGIWIARPYMTLLLFSSKVETLEKKAQLGQVEGDWVIIPSILVDAPILEGVSKSQLLSGVCHLSSSPLPGQGGNCIIEGHNLAEFGLWKPKSFFSLLDIVSEGTPIYIFHRGKKYSYRVKVKTFRNVSDPALYEQTHGERLTLITCVSTWSPTIYTNRRTVVTAYPGS